MGKKNGRTYLIQQNEEGTKSSAAGHFNPGVCQCCPCYQSLLFNLVMQEHESASCQD